MAPSAKRANELLKFHSAVKNNDVAEVENFLKLDPEIINLKDSKYGRTALHVAADQSREDSHFPTVIKLLKYGADVNVRTDSVGNTALHYLVINASIKTAIVLLKRNADVSLKNFHGEIPLFGAIRSENSSMVKLLLDHGSDLESVSKFGYTPVHQACTKSSLEILKLLVANGADVEAKDNNGHTPLWNMLKESNSKEKLEFFIEYSNVYALDPDGMDVLSIKMSEASYKVVIAHVCKLQALGLEISWGLLKSVYRKHEYDVYFKQCDKDLLLLRKTKFYENPDENESLEEMMSDLTYFDLLVMNKKKLKNYVDSEYFMNLKKCDFTNKLQVYGLSVWTNIEKIMKMRNLFEKSTKVLSIILPTFPNPSDLIIRNILDHLTSKDLEIFVSKIPRAI